MNRKPQPHLIPRNRTFAIPCTGEVPIRSERAATVARWFGLNQQVRPRRCQTDPPPAIDPARLLPRAGQIVLLTGASGAGKSSLLRLCRAHCRGPWIDLAEIALCNRPVVDCFEGLELPRILPLLSRVGLAEVWTYLRTPAELSEGQRWRLRLALALSRAHPRLDSRARSTNILAADEFAAPLDRITARIVAHALRKLITPASRNAAIVATSHDDLHPALRPDIIVRCDFGQIEVM